MNAPSDLCARASSAASASSTSPGRPWGRGRRACSRTTAPRSSTSSAPGGWDDHRYDGPPEHRSATSRSRRSSRRARHAAPLHGGRSTPTARRSSTPRRTSTPCTTASSRSASTRSIPKGLKLVERLIGICDALVENFSAEVLPSWGLTWERIHEINPRLVYMSTSGFGHSGDWKGYRSFGPTAAAQSGLSLASGLPGKPPAGWGFSYLDVMGGWMGGLALIQGLLQAKKTGKGFYIDYSVTEGAMSMLGHLHARLPGERPDARAARISRPATARSFPRWRRTTPTAARARTATGRTGGSSSRARRRRSSSRSARSWASRISCSIRKFATNEARVANQDELDAIVGRWTRARRRYDIMQQVPGGRHHRRGGPERRGPGRVRSAASAPRDAPDHQPSGDRRRSRTRVIR